MTREQENALAVAYCRNVWREILCELKGGGNWRPMLGFEICNALENAEDTHFSTRCGLYQIDVMFEQRRASASYAIAYAKYFDEMLKKKHPLVTVTLHFPSDLTFSVR
jgi:hypothetical protein